MLDGSMKQMKDLNQTIGEKIIYVPPSGGHKEESENAWGIRPKHGEEKKKKKKKREYFEMEKQNPPQKQ